MEDERKIGPLLGIDVVMPEDTLVDVPVGAVLGNLEVIIH